MAKVFDTRRILEACCSAAITVILVLHLTSAIGREGAVSHRNRSTFIFS
jgi:hypothetical protein